MNRTERAVRVLYSFPHKLGAQRICYAAWQHVQGLVNAGAEVLVAPGFLNKPFSGNVKVFPTLSRGRWRIPYKLLGTLGACRLHDWIVSRRLPGLLGKVDIIHTFPLGALRTCNIAKQLAIPTVLERCNAHTAFAYEVVRKECERLGITMPSGHEHDFNAAHLRREEAEYEQADWLFCPSEFVASTFLAKGFPREKLVKFQYGYDEKACYPGNQNCHEKRGLRVLFAAGCAPRKGLHFALEAWLRSPASRLGTFLIAGEFIPGYADKLAKLLAHPSVRIIGFRKDLPEVMRGSDVFVLPSIEEGSALVTYDARGCGCVLLVSDASGAVCEHLRNALVHPAGDVATLTQHFTMVDEKRSLLEELRTASLKTAHELTWAEAGAKMLAAYHCILAGRGQAAALTSSR